MDLKLISSNFINYILTENGDKNNLYSDFGIFALANKNTNNEHFGNEIMKIMNPTKLLYCYTLNTQSIDHKAK